MDRGIGSIQTLSDSKTVDVLQSDKPLLSV